MNKLELAQWLIRRVGGKVNDLQYADTEEIAGILSDDVETYLSILNDIVKEVLLP